MKQTLKTAMKASIFDVFETMFFMPLEFDEFGTFKDFFRSVGKDHILTCKLNFKSDFSGCFLLHIPENLLLRITENFLGINRHEINKNHLNGTIKEITNMIAGNTFSNFNEQSVFQLGLPKIIDTREHLNHSADKDDLRIFSLVKSIDGCFAIKLNFNR
ncbi:MAG: chemotaxis protein CheX [Desulfobacterales bacterium]|nr:chemotaxis protein CheX [Desulfobacterales bacterium]